MFYLYWWDGNEYRLFGNTRDGEKVKHAFDYWRAQGYDVEYLAW